MLVSDQVFYSFHCKLSMIRFSFFLSLLKQQETCCIFSHFSRTILEVSSLLCELIIIETCTFFSLPEFHCSELIFCLATTIFFGTRSTKSFNRNVLFFIEFMQLRQQHYTQNEDHKRFRPVCCDRCAGGFVLISSSKIFHCFPNDY